MIHIYCDCQTHIEHYHKLFKCQKVFVTSLTNIPNEAIVVLPFRCDESIELNNQLKDLYDRDCIILVSAGNDGYSNKLPYPANSKYTFAVGSHDDLNRISNFTNMGADFYALGKFENHSGTSYAVMSAAEIIDKNNITRNNLKSHLVKDLIKKKKEIPSNQLRLSSKSIPYRTPYDLSFNQHTNIQNRNIILKGKIDNSKSFIELCIEQLQKVPDNSFVPMSGGIDSEVVAQCFLKAKKPFQPVIMRYILNSQYMNSHDYSHAVQFCNKHKLKIKYVDLHLESFFKNRLQNYSYNYFCNSPQLACHLWLIRQLKPFYVMGGDLAKMINNTLTCPPLKYFSYYYANSNGIPNLFWYTPSIIIEGSKHNEMSTFGNYEQKIKSYESLGFTFDSNRIEKLTGFEKVKQWYDEQYSGYRVFDSLYRNPLEQAINSNITFSYEVE